MRRSRGAGALWVLPGLCVVLAIGWGPRTTWHPAQAAPADSAPHAVLVDSATLVHLERLAEDGEHEDGRCLLGVARSDSTFVFAAADAPWVVRNPWVNQDGAAGLSVRWDLCPKGTIGLWHSHPLALARRLYGDQRERWCRMSPPDFGTWEASGLPIMMISTRRHHTCTYVRLPGGVIGAHEPTP